MSLIIQTKTMRKMISMAGIAAVLIAAFILVQRATPKPLPQTLAPGSATAPQATGRTITWSVSRLTQTLFPGESVSVNLSFVSDEALSNVVIAAVPEIASLVNVQPSILAHVQAGQPQTIQVLFSIPTSTPLASYDGTVHVRSANRTVPATLKVSITVAVQQFQNHTLGFSVEYPPDWYVHPQGNSVAFSNAPAPGPLTSDPFTVDQASFIVRKRPQENPNLLSIDQWFQQVLLPQVPSAPFSTSTVIISGQSALRVDAADVGERAHIFVSQGADVIEITYKLAAPQYLGLYQTMQDSIRLP